MSAQPIALLAGPFDGSVPLVFLHRMEIFTSSNGQPCVPRRVICWDVGDMVSFLAAMQSNQGRALGTVRPSCVPSSHGNIHLF